MQKASTAKMNKSGKRRTDKTYREPISDRITVFGHSLLGNVGTGASGTQLFNPINLGVDGLGDRPNVFGRVYSRYRFKQLMVKYIPQVGSTTGGALALGFNDDTITSDTSSSGSYPLVIDFRCSGEAQVWSRFDVVWKPVDPSKWYYCSQENATSDTRFTQQLSLFGAGLGIAASTTVGNIVLYYTIEFEGAIAPQTPL